MRTMLVGAGLLAALISASCSGKSDSDSSAGAGGTAAIDAGSGGTTSTGGTAGSSEDGGVTVDAPDPACDATQDIVEAAHQWAAAACGGPEGCCKGAGFGFDTGGCIAQLEPFAVARLKMGVCAGGKLNPVALDACVTKLEAYGKTCTGYNGEAWGADFACEHIAVGSKAAGEPCDTEVECNALLSQDGICGCSDSNCVCKLWQVVPLGSACEFLPEGIVGNICDKSKDETCDVTGKCVPMQVLGGVCSPAVPCASGLFCDANKCQAVKPPGSNCSESKECAPGSACIGNVCAGTAGSACITKADCAEDCVANRCTPTMSWIVSSINVQCAP